MRTRMLARARSEDGGWAMVTVMGTMMVLSILVAVAMWSATSSIASSRRGQDSAAAVAAAQAGVQHYLNQLNLNATYFQRFNTPDASNPALSASTFTPVSAGGEQQFRYQLLSSPAEVQQTGTIVLEATGRSRGVERTVQVTLANESIFKYLYYTDFETGPPLVSGVDPTTCTAHSHTDLGQTTTRPTSPTCSDVRFVDGDRIRGPLHTQDRLMITGSPVFEGTVETGWNDTSTPYRGWTAVGAATPDFQAGLPMRVNFPFPRYNRELREQAASGNGCLYTGPTRILFHANSTMTVTSRYTATASPTCGTFTSFNNWTSTVPVQDGGVVWVDKSTSSTCTMDEVRAATVFPLAGDDSLLGGTTPLFHNCVAGTVFVEGWVDGRTTVAAADNVFVTGSLRYVGAGDSAVGTPIGTITADTSGDDVLGLYAEAGYVAVYNPLDCTTRSANAMCAAGSPVSRLADAAGNTTRATAPSAYPLQSVQLDAAIIAPQAFLVPNHFLAGDRGTITFIGSMAQRFRGAVSRTTSGVLSGFRKDYNYDRRLKALPPPFLADITATAWGVSQFAEGPR